MRGFARALRNELTQGHDLDLGMPSRWVRLLVLAGQWLGLAWWSFAVEPRPFQSRHVLETAFTLVVLLATLTAAYQRQSRSSRRERQAIVLLLGAASLAMVAVQRWYGPGLAGIGLSMIMASGIGLFGLLLGALVIAGYLTTVSIQAAHIDPLIIVFGAVGLGWAYAGPVLGRRERRRMLEQAATEERERLAREIHDVLAHTLTALSVQLEGARMVMEERPGDPKAMAAVERAQRLAVAGLEETHQAVAALRGDSRPGPESLSRLVDDFQRETSVPSRLQIEGQPVALRPDVGLAIHRTAQEALTNVRKHAEPTDVALRLRYLAGAVELTVTDRGRPKHAATSGGYGLMGIRERAELLGGRLESGPTPDGFEIRLRVPS